MTQRRAGLAALAASCALAGAVAGCAKPPPRVEIAVGQNELNRLLASANTEQELTAFAGVPAHSCLEAPPSGRLCEWRLGNRDPGYAALAGTLPTGDRINLLCVIPRRGARGPDSCTVFPQRSNRYRYELPTSGPDPKAREAYADAEARHRQQATAELAGARTLVDLANLMGAAPDACTAPSAGMRSCTWLATGRTYGHGTLAVSLSAPVREKVEMDCALPADGRPRASGSCRVEVPGHQYAGQR
jgi:hypothetical protein